jgi:hypothetical protein
LEKILNQGDKFTDLVDNEVLSLRIWERLMLPALKTSVMVGSTHYLKNAVTKAVVAFLMRLFERLTFLSNNQIIETITEVIKSLSGTK